MAAKVSFHIIPGSEKFKVKGFDEWRNAWVVSLRAKPEKELANKELIDELSQLVGERPKIISGSHSREKVLEFREKTHYELFQILGKQCKSLKPGS
ncbi:MAG: DUF167 domain-containing protein [Candidatus Diapherotrites archaeon]